VLNRQGRGTAVLVCEHASHFIPAGYDRLGLSAADQLRHIGWDIGALGLARNLSALLDAPLVHATYSRLLLDLNRPVAAQDSIVLQSEDTRVPGNAGLASAERDYRRQHIYAPFHAELDALIDQRLQSGQATAVVSIHSFTPSYHGVARPWHVGVISKDDRQLADALLQALAANTDLCIGDNLPYGPDDGVYHSLQRHGEARGLRGAMIEVRNDLLDELGQKRWAHLLNEALSIAFARTNPAS
jgi:predicted N-formylglutamate amidohydrolase